MTVSTTLSRALLAACAPFLAASLVAARPDNPAPAAPTQSKPTSTSRTARQIADEAREQSRSRITDLLVTNKWTPQELYRVLRAGCTGRLPPSRIAVQSLSRLLGDAIQKVELSQAQASSLGATVSAAVNADLLSRRELDGRLAELGLTLTSLTIGRDTFVKIRDAFERAVAEQNRPELLAVASSLRALRTTAQPGPEQAQVLAAAITPLAKGTVKPPPERITDLASALVSALGTFEVKPFEAAQTARNCETVLAGEPLSKAEFDAVLNDTASCLSACGVQRPEWERVLVALRLLDESVRPDQQR